MENKPFKRISTAIKEKVGESVPVYIYLICISLFIILYNSTLSLNYDLGQYPSAVSVIRLLRRLIICILVFNSTVLIGEHSVKEFICYTLIAAVFVYNSHITGDNNLLLSLIFVYCTRGIMYEEAAKAFLYTYIIITVAIITAHFTGILQDYWMPRNEILWKHSLGFDHPNSLGRVLYVIHTCFVIAYPKECRKVWFYVFSLLMIVFSYLVPNCRAAVISIAVTVALVFVFDKWAWIREKSNYLACFVFILCGSFSVINTVLYDPFSAVLQFINVLSTGRFSAARQVLDTAGWGRLFGNNVYWLGIPIDNCYNKFFLCFGIICFIIFAAGNFIAVHRSHRYRLFNVIACLISFMIFGVFEMHMYYIMDNITLLAITACMESGIFKEGEHGDQTHTF